MLIIIAVLLGLGGCRSTKILQATGGSRSDGVVELSYEYGAFEIPEVDWGQGLMTACERCKAWGYSNAEAFGGAKSSCLRYDGYGGCVRYLVTISYQCIGSPD